MEKQNQNLGRAWLVTSAGVLINLALGTLYAWSVLKEAIADSIAKGGEGAFNWDLSTLNGPYSVCVLAFAFSMMLAGKIQDVKGPAFTTKIGGVLVGLGFVVASLSTNYYLWILGFGILAGVGIGFGYSATTPAALKWFPASKSGMIAGIVVSGFGLAPVIIAPTTSVLVSNFGLQNTMMIFGIAFFIIISGLGFVLNNPPEGFVPVDNSKNSDKKPAKVVEDKTARDMLKSARFYIIWVIFFIGSGAGLMVIGNISGMAKASMGASAFIAVAIMAVGNASGRVIAGVVSDIISRPLTLLLILIFQTLLMFTAYLVVGEGTSALVIVLLATFIGFNYGTNLSLFPSFTKSYWGMKNFGLNYGVLMSAWGLGGFVFSNLSQVLYANSGSHSLSFIIAGVCLIVCIALTSYVFKMEKAEI